MFFSGISDEAGRSIDKQIEAHLELGWEYMELRGIEGVNLTQLPEDQFDKVYGKVTEAGLKVSCFASGIANWARPITCDPQADIAELRQAIPRMRRFGTRLIRIMSYPNDPNRPLDEKQWRNEAIRRVKVFAKMAEEGGVILAHENCSGWGGLSAENSNILLGEVDSPALKVVYDTGNPVTYGQDAWEYYTKVRDSIVYMHIKDARRIDGEDQYTYCGEGDGRVRETVADLLATGYDGGFSIEPHLGAIGHTGASSGPAVMYQTYTEYGRRLMAIVREAQAG